MSSRYLKPLKRELGRYLPEGVAPLKGALFECSFEYDDDLDMIEELLAEMPDIEWSRSETKGEERLVGRSKGKQIVFELFERAGKWRLDVRFREMGRSWGSNEAYYMRFREEAFQLLGVTSVTHLRPTFRRKL